MALKDWELRHNKTRNKWMWVNITEAEPILECARKRYANLKNGFYPYEFNFLYYSKEDALQCSYCGIVLPSRRLTKDHIYPKSRGGCITTPCCNACNQAKGDKKPIEWAIFYSQRELDLAHLQQTGSTRE